MKSHGKDQKRVDILRQSPHLVMLALEQPQIVYSRLEMKASGHWSQVFAAEDPARPGRYLVVAISLAKLPGEPNSKYHQVTTIHPAKVDFFFRKGANGEPVLKERWVRVEKRRTGS